MGYLDGILSAEAGGKEKVEMISGGTAKEESNSGVRKVYLRYLARTERKEGG